jgi:DnaJ-like protein
VQANEALDLLSLRPGATPSEIKQAYRDLVKVWHPDRFGADTQLRRKAEDKLKEMNEAYRVLQSPAGANGAYDSGEVRAATSTHRSATQRPSQRVVIVLGDKASRPAYAVVCVLLLVAIFAASFVIHHRTTRIEKPSTPVEGGPDAARFPQVPDREEAKILPESGSNSSGQKLRDVPSAGGSADSATSEQFRVRSLSDADAERLESACERQKERQDPTAYHECVKAQLSVITNASERPDLSTLSESERESIESVCSESKIGRDATRLNRCLTVQAANLAAEPTRPNWSAVTDDDRDAIETACRSAKYRKGPAAHDRCLARAIDVLKQSR